LGNDATFSTTMMAALAARIRYDAVQTLNGTQKAQALSNMGLVVGTAANNIFKLDGSGKIPALDGSQLTNLTWGNITGRPPVIGTAAALNAGTGPNNVVQLDGSSKLPAVDGSQLTGVIAASTSAVVFNAAQTLTAPQQDQARQNIGAFSGGGYSNIVGLYTGANSMSINADAIALFDASGHVYGATSVALALNLSGVGANGLDTGVMATGNYYYFVIYNPTTNTLACLASASLSPTMPSGYTYKRRIGWFFYSGGITPFAQRNAQFTWSPPRVLVTGTQTLAAYIPLASFVAPNATRVFGSMISNNNTVSVGDNSGNILAQIGNVTSGQCFYGFSFTPQNTAYQLQYASSSTGGEILISGWEDNI
jgi:hypothetical protein